MKSCKILKFRRELNKRFLAAAVLQRLSGTSTIACRLPAACHQRQCAMPRSRVGGSVLLHPSVVLQVEMDWILGLPRWRFAESWANYRSIICPSTFEKKTFVWKKHTRQIFACSVDCSRSMPPLSGWVRAYSLSVCSPAVSRSNLSKAAFSSRKNLRSICYIEFSDINRILNVVEKNN